MSLSSSKNVPNHFLGKSKEDEDLNDEHHQQSSDVSIEDNNIDEPTTQFVIKTHREYDVSSDIEEEEEVEYKRVRN
jgi:hypothetical protein